MMARTANLPLLVLGMLIGLGGCMPAPPLETVLRPDLGRNSEGSPALTLVESVQVLPLRARGILGDGKLAFSRDDRPGEVMQSGRFRWDEPPARMMERGLIHYLRSAAKPGTSVLAADNRAVPQYWISGTVMRFEKVEAPLPAVVVALELAVIKAESRNLVSQGSYCASEMLADDSPGSMVEAVERASARVFRQFAKDLSPLKSGPSQPSTVREHRC